MSSLNNTKCLQSEDSDTFREGYMNLGFFGIPEAILLNLAMSCGMAAVLVPFWIYSDRLLVSMCAKDAVHLNRDDVAPKGAGSPMTSWDAFTSWIRDVFSISWWRLDSDVLAKKYSLWAYEFLAYQRYVIVLFLIFAVVTCGAIMPIHLHQHDENKANSTSFEAMSMLSVPDPSDEVFWVHTGVAWTFTVVAFAFMGMFAQRVVAPIAPPSARATILISGISRGRRSAEGLARWLATKYPFARVRSITMVYNTTVLFGLHGERDQLTRTVAACSEKDALFRMYTRCRRGVPARQFYVAQLAGVNRDIASILAEKRTLPLDKAFVEMESADDARFIYEMENMLSKIRDSDMRVRFAPPIEDLQWENMVRDSVTLVREVTIGVILLAFAVAVLTPELAISQLYFLEKIGEKIWIAHYLQGYIEVLIRWLASRIIVWGIKFVGSYSCQSVNYRVVSYGTAYLLAIMLFFPTLNFWSIANLWNFLRDWVDSGFATRHRMVDRWHCIFRANVGIEMVIFVVNSATFGNFMELFLIYDAFVTVVDVCVSRSWPEALVKTRLRRSVYWLGEAYNNELSVLAITMAFAFAFPIILPFGLLHMIVHHVVVSVYLQEGMRAYLKPAVGADFHYSAIGYTVATPVFLQLFSSLLLNLRLGGDNLNSVAISSGVASVVCFLLLVVQADSEWTFPFKIASHRKQMVDDKRHRYIPPYVDDLVRRYKSGAL